MSYRDLLLISFGQNLLQRLHFPSWYILLARRIPFRSC
jgi:hypothetical protein